MPNTIQQIQDGTSIQSIVNTSGNIETSVSSVEVSSIQSVVDTSGNIETSVSGVIGVNSLSELDDVDLFSEGRQDGSVLVYKVTTNKWTSTKLLNKQTVDAGEF